MKLFYFPGACSLAPHIVAEELGIKLEAIKIDPKAKTYAGGDFKKVNPKGYVPALVLDNGEVLTEVGVILQYLADQKPEKKLLPKAGTWERYRALEWLNFIATEVHKGFSPLFASIPDEAKQYAKEQLAKRLGYIEENLKGKEYLMGEYSVADAYLYTVANWARFLKYDLTPFPGVMGFLERVHARPATTAARHGQK